MNHSKIAHVELYILSRSLLSGPTTIHAPAPKVVLVVKVCQQLAVHSVLDRVHHLCLSKDCLTLLLNTRGGKLGCEGDLRQGVQHLCDVQQRVMQSENRAGRAQGTRTAHAFRVSGQGSWMQLGITISFVSGCTGEQCNGFPVQYQLSGNKALQSAVCQDASSHKRSPAGLQENDPGEQTSGPICQITFVLAAHPCQINLALPLPPPLPCNQAAFTLCVRFSVSHRSHLTPAALEPVM